MNKRKRTWLIAALALVAAAAALLLTVKEPAAPAPAAALEEFRYSRTGPSRYDIYSYELSKDGESGEMTVSYDLYSGSVRHMLPADEEIVREIEALVRKNGLWAWDGFDRSAPGVLDGTGFSLSIVFADGTRVYAHGNNSFPEGYAAVADGADELFLGYLKQNGIIPEGGQY